MKQTSKRTILFRQNINRTNEEWAHFLEGYRDDLMKYDMETFGDDYHTAEDVVSEIFLNIITEPIITNLHPDKGFHQTLLTLCRHKHNDFTKPWRKELLKKFVAMFSLIAPRRDLKLETLLGFGELIVKNLLDESLDGGRSYVGFSLTDLERWRKLYAAGPDAKAVDVAAKLGISKSLLSKSCAKVNKFIVETAREMMRRQGLL